MRVVMYLRAAVDSGGAIDAQRAVLSRHLADRGWRAAGEYTDVGDGCAAARRPGLAMLLDRIRTPGDVDAVAVTGLDRLSRDPAELLDLHRGLASAGVTLVSAAQPDVEEALGVLSVVTGYTSWADSRWTQRPRHLPVAGHHRPRHRELGESR